MRGAEGDEAIQKTLRNQRLRIASLPTVAQNDRIFVARVRLERPGGGYVEAGQLCQWERARRSSPACAQGGCGDICDARGKGLWRAGGLR